MSIQITDRYDALGISPPDVETMCKGQCEGIGFYPQYGDDPDITDAERAAWNEAEAKAPSDDGFHFIKCGDCDGSGKAKAAA